LSGLDEEVFRVLNMAGSSTVLDAVMIAISVLGTTYALVILASIIWLKRRRELAFDCLVLLAIVSILVFLLKYAVDRARPFEVLDDVDFASISLLSSASDPSMPSGHASKTFAIAALVALSRHKKAGALLLALACAVALTRIYLGLHWPSDVLAGAVLGVSLGALFHAFSRRLNRYRLFQSWAIGRLSRIAGYLSAPAKASG